MPLKQTISEFEELIPDVKLPQLAARLMQADGSDPAVHFYLLGRMHELLGRYVGYTPGLGGSPQLSWHEALTFYERAGESAKGDVRAFLEGKNHFLSFLISGPRSGPRDRTHLIATKSCFEQCFRLDRDEVLAEACRWYLALADFYLQHELRLEDLLLLLGGLEQTPSGSEARSAEIISGAMDRIAEFEQEILRLARQSETLSLTHQRYLEAEGLLAWAKLHELIQTRMVNQMRSATVKSSGSIVELLKRNQQQMLTIYGKASETLRDLGLGIGELHTRAHLKKQNADQLFHHCTERFSAAMQRDRELRDKISLVGGSYLFALEDEFGPLLPVTATPTMILPELREAFRQSGRDLSETATIVTAAGESLVRDPGHRYRIKDLQVFDISDQGIVFDPAEPETFKAYGEHIHQTVRAYIAVIRDIESAFKKTEILYREVLDQNPSFSGLGSDSADVRFREQSDEDADARSVFVNVASLLEMLQCNHFPLVSLFRDRIIYVWSLLEMFQMRNQSVRLNTLFSGECRLLMEDPYEPGHFLEIGGDPVFRMAIPLLFRGSRGDDEIRLFMRLLLHSAINTYRTQQVALDSEYQYIDPNLTMERYRQMQLRLACHEHLAQGILAFVDPFLRHVDQIGDEILKDLTRADRSIDEAQRFQDEAGFRLSLMGKKGLAFLKKYIQGVGSGRKGMILRRHKDASWENFYDTAIYHLEEARQLLHQVDGAYLLGDEARRGRFSRYIEARIHSIAAWRAKYLFADHPTRVDLGREAVKQFREASEQYRQIDDSVGSTQARARSDEMKARVELSDGAPTDDQLYRSLRSTKALYASCGDIEGFSATVELLVTHFPARERILQATAVNQNR